MILKLLKMSKSQDETQLSFWAFLLTVNLYAIIISLLHRYERLMFNVFAIISGDVDTSIQHHRSSQDMTPLEFISRPIKQEPGLEPQTTTMTHSRHLYSTSGHNDLHSRPPDVQYSNQDRQYKVFI